MLIKYTTIGRELDTWMLECVYFYKEHHKPLNNMWQYKRSDGLKY
jgi:hypothetical protein